MMAENRALMTTGAPLPASLATVLTRQFYDWEERGRGWLLWPEPVAIEPAFAPFWHHIPRQVSLDDGREHTFWSRLVARVTGAPNIIAPPLPGPLPDDFLRLPEPDDDDSEIIEYRLLPSRDDAISGTLAKHLLLHLTASPSPVSYEIMGSDSGIECRLACREPFSQSMTDICRSFIPGCAMIPVTSPLAELLEDRHSQALVIDFGLSQEFIRPLTTFGSFQIDPLAGVVSALRGLRAGELGMVQVLISRCRHAWARNILRAVSDTRGGCFFADAPEMLAHAKAKIQEPLYSVVLRVAAVAMRERRVWEIARNIGDGLAVFNDPLTNQLIPLDNWGYDDSEHVEALIARKSYRSGMVLNASEVVSIVHPPTSALARAGLATTSINTKAAPTMRPGVTLGHNLHHGSRVEVTLGITERLRHTHIIGGSGTGKSTLFLNLLCQDMEAGLGVGLLDPHGDLADAVLARVPKHRLDDVILFDPADAEYPVGFNILDAQSELERTLLASDMVGVFRQFATTWGDQMTTVLGNAVIAMLESETGGTLADLRRFLVEKDFRADFLRTVRDDSVVYYWQREFPMLSGRPQSAILTRLDAFLRSKTIRHIVTQRENRLDFPAMMRDGRIFIARLSQGAIGEDNAYLLGSLIVSKLHQAALARQALPEEHRRPFLLYLDEFQNFITPSMDSILTGVRKYGLGLVLAHQELRQLEKRGSEVAHAVMTNPYARVCFRVGDADAKKLAGGFTAYTTEDLLNLGTGEAIVRFEQARHDFNMTTLPAVEMPPDAVERRAYIVEHSRRRYATAREEVEARLATSVAREAESPEPARSSKQKQPKVPRAGARRPVEPPPSETRPSPPPPSPAPTPDMGKGGQEHRYLQQLIKRWSEGMGYKATIEKQLDNGGSVDIALEKGPVSIACEITVTTTPEHELKNLCKCLGTDFTHVVAVGLDPKKIQRVRALAEQSLPEPELARMVFCEPAGLFDLIQRLEAENASHETTVNGYRVNVNYTNLSERERLLRRERVSKVVVKAMKKG